MRARRRGRFTVSWEGCRRGTWGLTVTQDTPKVFDAWPFLRTFAKDAPRATSDSCNSGATVARTHGLYAAAAGPGEGWRVARGDDAWESDPTPPRVVCVKDRTQSMGRGPPYMYIYIYIYKYYTCTKSTSPHVDPTLISQTDPKLILT